MSVVQTDEDRWSALERRILQLERLIASQALAESPEFTKAATFLPSVFRLIKDSGNLRSQHYSPYWHDQEVRAMMIALHRQVTIADAVEAIAREVGVERAPSKSALGRIWKQLDAARGAA
ncbi:MAG: hypothetical protein U0975_09765 [Erythrobacter sp.]|nr:hypothetical protein [Erythrobacter sp.]MDZ4272947.1 hypothetical protein [Erythrobacter sp.]